MTEIVVIVAIAENNAIGKDNDIPWHIPEDFKHFQQKTMGHPCIMGDKTYDSLPKRPLPGRENIVCTLDKEYTADGAKIFHDFYEALEYVKDKDKAFIIGGATIYKLGMKVADTFELTRVHMSPEADTFYPEINWNEWELINEEPYEKYSFLTYKRVRK